MSFVLEYMEDGSERALVRNAAVSKAGREKLKQELLPHAIEATKAFMRSGGIPENRESELIEVAMEPFDRVFSIYLKNAQDRDTEEGHFYAYYAWWVRKAIAEYLYNESQN